MTLTRLIIRKQLRPDARNVTVSVELLGTGCFQSRF
jgi:hypothetical protein